MDASKAEVLLIEHPTASGHKVAEARLNSPATLNALSLDMIDLLRPALARWRADACVVAVVFTSAGDRAFSAGGDIQALYHAMVRNHEIGERVDDNYLVDDYPVDDYPYEFFEREYRLDFALHTFEKPVVALGHGVIMGGGLGIFSAAKYRLVTERVRIAFPEVTIGLFPDAGATWLLRNLPEHVALFLGLTGSSINSQDARSIGLATHAIAQSEYATLLERICALGWSGVPAADSKLIADFLPGCAQAALPEGQLPAIPETLHCGGDLVDVVNRIRALQGLSDWVDRGIAAMGRGCPTTIGIVVRQLVLARNMSLADCFRLEMTVATHCADNHDFVEGVRALIIDKDNTPDWQFGDLESLPVDYVESHFVEPWPQNPLYDLED
jgi:enoyl-CoA hydratase/carnithine racemase